MSQISADQSLKKLNVGTIPKKSFIPRPSSLRFEIIVVDGELVQQISRVMVHCKSNVTKTKDDQETESKYKWSGKYKLEKLVNGVVKTVVVPKLVQHYSKLGHCPLRKVSKKNGSIKKKSKIKKSHNKLNSKKMNEIVESCVSSPSISCNPSSLFTPSRSSTSSPADTSDPVIIPFSTLSDEEVASIHKIPFPSVSSSLSPPSPPPSPPSPSINALRLGSLSPSLKRKREETEQEKDIVELIEKRRKTQFAEVGILKQPARTKTAEVQPVLRYLQKSREELFCTLSSQITDLVVSAIGVSRRKAASLNTKKQKLDKKIGHLISVRNPI
ncbi:hypothetical protein BKA69DRAFT_621133 [Paraphysoderma sedebokerense]|nr:hypothetical protein BKA69DRAFT_621133 [Paraphysoderma sedebokerense]